MNSFLQLFKIVGAFTAVVLCIGFISTTDHSPLEAGEASVEEMSFSSSSSSGKTIALSDYNASESGIRSRPSTPMVGDRPVRTVASDREINTFEASKGEVSGAAYRSGSSRISARDIENWIQMNVAQTYLEAEKETMSPGVILATGVYFLQQGQGDTNMNAADVAAYLAEVRENAATDAKAKMKYIANSKEWFSGLNLAGFDGDKIAGIFASHQLSAYDKQMYARHVERKLEQQDYATEDGALSGDREARKRDLADAYNDYADRPEVRKKYGLPTLRAAKPMSEGEVSVGRKEAESFRRGQEKEYDDPRFFWSVLQEMIALEHDYKSWDAYRSAHQSAADKEFEARSNIMALGGVMMVRRK